MTHAPNGFPQFRRHDMNSSNRKHAAAVSWTHNRVSDAFGGGCLIGGGGGPANCSFISLSTSKVKVHCSSCERSDAFFRRICVIYEFILSFRSPVNRSWFWRAGGTACQSSGSSAVGPGENGSHGMAGRSDDVAMVLRASEMNGRGCAISAFFVFD